MLYLSLEMCSFCLLKTFIFLLISKKKCFKMHDRPSSFLLVEAIDPVAGGITLIIMYTAAG